MRRSPPLLLLAVLLLAGRGYAIDTVYPQQPERSSPDLLSEDGRLLAKGTQVTERFEGGFQVRTSYRFTDGRQVAESVRMSERPQLAQEAWTWEERGAGGALRRYFEVDFRSGVATAFKQERDGPKRWSVKLDLEPGTTFSGAGFVYAIKNLQPRLAQGEKVRLKAVGMTPKPRVVNVELRSRGAEEIQMGGRTWAAEHVTLHPRLGLLVGLVANVPDFQFWLSRESPPELLRALYTLAEPGDPLVRADTYGAQPSARAQRRR
ncbi:MAG: SPRY domain-containing protein [Myxococcaceae bacterium]